jgi:hypothetical protein
MFQPAARVARYRVDSYRRRGLLSLRRGRPVPVFFEGFTASMEVEFSEEASRRFATVVLWRLEAMDASRAARRRRHDCGGFFGSVGRKVTV